MLSIILKLFFIKFNKIITTVDSYELYRLNNLDLYFGVVCYEF